MSENLGCMLALNWRDARNADRGLQLMESLVATARHKAATTSTRAYWIAEPEFARIHLLVGGGAPVNLESTGDHVCENGGLFPVIAMVFPSEEPR